MSQHRPSIAFRIRQNHAFEHATLHIASKHGLRHRLAGISYWSGYLLLGQVSTSFVQLAANEALQSLKNGQSELAIHSHCGTNVAATGLIAILAALLSWEAWQNLWLRSLGIAAGLVLSVFVGPDLGTSMQKHVTTTPHVETLEIKGLRRLQIGKLVIHQVRTEAR